MRVADKMNFNHINRNIAKNRTEMADLQGQAATQKRINKPSDDPLSSARVLALRTDERSSDQFLKNIANARQFLETTDQALGELTEILSRAKELALGQASDGSSNPETKRAVASEVEQLFFQTLQVGNRKLGDRFIFGGHQTESQPFTNKGIYNGDDGDIRVQVNKDTFLPVNVPGDRVFLGYGLSNDGVIRPANETPTSVEELVAYREADQLRKSENEKAIGQMANVEVGGDSTQGENLIQALNALMVGLISDDKHSTQDSIDALDAGIAQVIQARAQVGSRVHTLNLTEQSLQKSIQDSKATASQHEDADAFKVISDINKTDSALRATLETSGKLVQTSLLDFLR